MGRRIKRAKIKFLSLVPKGANRLPTIFKSDDGAFEVSLLAKDLSEKGELHAVVYAPEFRDSQGDIASAAVVKDMLYTAAREGLEIDIRHDGKAISKEQAYVAESFLVQKGDPRFQGLTDYDGNPVDPTGSWGVVVKIEDPELRKLYREGKWRGVSMGGSAEVEQEKEDLADRIAERLAKKFNPQEEDTMTDEQLEKLTKGIVSGVAAALKPQPTEEPAAKSDEAPAFKGDPTSVEDVRAHRDALKKHALQQRLAKASSPAEIDKILKELEGGESDELAKANEELAKAQAKIAKLTKGSNQPPASDQGSDTSDEPTGFQDVSKEHQEAARVGSAMAAWANQQRAR